MSDPRSREAALGLEACLHIEQTLAELYDGLARAHRDVVEVAGLWRRLAEEEREHARQLELVLRTLRTMKGEVRIDAARAEESLALLRRSAALLREHPPKVARALELALSLEERFVKIHAAYAVEFVEASQRRLFETLSAADARHVAAVRDLLTRWKASGA
jgi:rubrerythrin